MKMSRLLFPRVALRHFLSVFAGGLGHLDEVPLMLFTQQHGTYWGKHSRAESIRGGPTILSVARGIPQPCGDVKAWSIGRERYQSVCMGQQ